jgi:S-DNA-T family DNA segregation ATPase FtsK/SpoIIIE
MQVAVRLPQPPRHEPATGGPWRVDPLPGSLAYAAARELPREPGADVVLGVGGDTLQRLGGSLQTAGPGFFVAGEPRTGRSTALLSIGLDLLVRGVTLVVVAPVRTSPLRALLGVEGVAAFLNLPNPTARHLELALAAVLGKPFVVLVDDADRLPGPELPRVLREHVFDSPDPGVGAVVAAGLESVGHFGQSLAADAGRGGTGLLTGPRNARVHLFGTLRVLPEAYLTDVAGRSVLLRPDGLTPVQVPLPSPADLAALPRASQRAALLLNLADTLAGPTLASVPKFQQILSELAPLHDLTPDAVERVTRMARGWTGTAAQLLESAAAPV